MKLKDLQSLANEINEICQLDPEISTNQSKNDLQEDIKRNLPNVCPDDDFSGESWDMLIELGWTEDIAECDPSADEVREMDLDQLKDLVEEYEVEFDKKTMKDPKKLAEALIEELELEEEDAGEEEQEQEEPETETEGDDQSEEDDDQAEEDDDQAEEDEQDEQDEGGDEEDEELTWEELQDMKKKDLVELINENELEINTKNKKADALRQEIWDVLSEDEEGDEQDEEDDQGEETITWDDINSMKKKELTQLIDDHELDVEKNLKVADLKQSIWQALTAKDSQEEIDDGGGAEEDDDTEISIPELRDMRPSYIRREMNVEQCKKANELYNLEMEPSDYRTGGEFKEAFIQVVKQVSNKERKKKDQTVHDPKNEVYSRKHAVRDAFLIGGTKPEIVENVDRLYLMYNPKAHANKTGAESHWGHFLPFIRSLGGLIVERSEDGAIYRMNPDIISWSTDVSAYIKKLKKDLSKFKYSDY